MLELRLAKHKKRKSPVSDDGAFLDCLERVMGIEPFPAPRCDPQRPALLALQPAHDSIFPLSLAVSSTQQLDMSEAYS
ncbi:conserved protein of unknown function [Ectopseudomonas oleovorans]|uniref:Uncharacterized protein n=1 Tax=Ectopseudomonas oleovorans TaxID=301 RepID=A0A653B8L1_ECTOL|nr:conserved protein of unknown function [Pseudomonas oleovorans]